MPNCIHLLVEAAWQYTYFIRNTEHMILGQGAFSA
jgi:hypothetical protein